MKIDIQKINQDHFTIIENLIGGERCYLVVPKKSYYGWTRETLIFRSSIWNEHGEPVSLSFKKFFNWGERDELTYTPFSMTANGGVSLFEKIDGSTLIVSKYKKTPIARTRGTFDARNLPNGFEIEILKTKYPHIFDGSWCSEDTASYSLVFEWTSPTNQIVIKHGEPEIFLLAVINHDYTMATQAMVDQYATQLKVKRPKVYKFKTIKEMLTEISKMRDFEGVCVYCSGDQEIRKVKTEWYLNMHHALTEEFSSFERMVEFYFSNGMPTTYQEFFAIVVNYQDYEIATYLRGDISRITDAMKEVRKIHQAYTKFAAELHITCKTRKEMVDKVFSTHGNTNRAGMILALYDGKELDSDSWKKLFFQVIKK